MRCVVGNGYGHGWSVQDHKLAVDKFFAFWYLGDTVYTRGQSETWSRHLSNPGSKKPVWALSCTPGVQEGALFAFWL